MKQIVSISLGNSSRDSDVTVTLAGEEFHIRRIGTNGSIPGMKQLFRELDGTVDAFGIGGFDLFIYAGRGRKIPFPEPNKIVAGIKTPVYDGSILKLTLEPLVIDNLHQSGVLDLSGLSAFCLAGSDRFGMAEILYARCRQVTYGDLMVSLELPIPIRSLSTLVTIAGLIGPIVVRLPFSWIYPTGEKAGRRSPKLESYFHSHDIIAGDFHYVLKYRPDNLQGKIIITNTTTEPDIRLLQDAGVKMVVTTTPQLGGRTFGTNVMEAVIATLIGHPAPTEQEFSAKISELHLDKGQIFTNHAD